MINFRIFTENYADIDILAYYEASSEQSAFPIENAFNYQRRSKVWRSNGYYEVTSTNNVLNFRDSSGGADLYAIMNTDIYTSTADFITELARAMNSAGGSATYSVTHDGYRFMLTSAAPASGMFVYYSTSTCASLIGLTQNHGVAGVFTQLMDDIAITTLEYVLIDMGVPTNPDAFILLDARNQSIQIPPTGTVKLEANETSNFSAPSFSYTLPINDLALSYLTTTGIASSQYRYWRIYFDSECAMPNGYVQIGALFLGNCFNPTRGRAQFPLENTYIDRSATLFSEGGQSFSDVGEISTSFRVEFYGLQKADIEEFDDFFNRVGTAKPFFVSMDSGTVFSTSINRRIILCKFDSEPSWSLESPDNFSLSFTLREEL